MSAVTLECKKRPEGSKPNALRREGWLPASLYGHKGAESMSLVVKTKDAETLLKNAQINNTLVDVKVPDLSWQGRALIREVQAHPWKRYLYHLSFFAVAGHGSLQLVVPVEIVGTPPGVKTGGGILEQIMTEFNIECVADRIPESIPVDVSKLELGESLQAEQIDFPEGVTLLDDPESTVVSIATPRVEAASEATSEGSSLLDAAEAAMKETAE